MLQSYEGAVFLPGSLMTSREEKLFNVTKYGQKRRKTCVLAE